MEFSQLPRIAAAKAKFDSLTGCNLQISGYLKTGKKVKDPLGLFTTIENLLRQGTKSNTISVSVAWEATGKGYDIRTYVSANAGYIFSQDALKAFTDSLNDRHSETLSAIVEPKKTHGKIIAALEALRAGVTPDTGDFEIQLFEGNRRFRKDTFLLITALPQPSMPDIRVKPFRQKYAGDEEVEMRLQVEYKRRNRSNEQIRDDNDYYPAGGWKKVKVNEVWDVDFGDDIRGGKVTVYCKSANTTISEVFYIRGVNPSEQAVRDYLAESGYNQWFLMKMIRQESVTLTAGADMRQFRTGTAYGAGWENTIGCPTMGDPRGFGLMQLDNWGTATNPQHATPQQLWDWQKNLDGGQAVLQEKLVFLNNVRSLNDRIINDWNQYRPNNPVSNSMQIIAGDGSGTIVTSITEGANGRTETFAINPTPTQRDIYDARWIKSYNSGNAFLYYQVLEHINNQGKPLKPTQVINRTNGANSNYVGELCSRHN